MKLQNTDFVNYRSDMYDDAETILESIFAGIAMIALIAVVVVLLYMVAPV